MYQKWLEAFYHVATEGGFTAAARETITMAELDVEPMIVRKSSSTTQAGFDQAAEAGVSITPAFEIESREGHALFPLVVVY